MNTAYNREDNDRAKSNAYIDVSQSKRNVLRCKSVGPLHTVNTKHSEFNQMSSIVTKQTKWHVRPAKNHISLGIRPVWSASDLSLGIRPVWSVFAVRLMGS